MKNVTSKGLLSPIKIPVVPFGIFMMLLYEWEGGCYVRFDVETIVNTDPFMPVMTGFLL